MMRNRLSSKTVQGPVLVLFATLVLAQPAAALNAADYWRGGWRTPLGDEPHIYYFLIREKTGIADIVHQDRGEIDPRIPPNSGR